MSFKSKCMAITAALTASVICCSPLAANAEQLSERWVWDKLLSSGCSEAGTAGIIANLDAESGLRSDNLEDSFEYATGISDEAYVQGVDNGTYTDFVNDSAGFGLLQVTYYSRKAMFIDMARERGVSIADPSFQIDFIMSEMSMYYPSLLSFLKTTDDVDLAARRVMCEYEQPGDQSDTAVADRQYAAQVVYSNNTGSAPVQTEPDFQPDFTWTDEPDAAYDINVGDIMMYTGTMHHTSAYDTDEGLYCGSGKVMIMAVHNGGSYRYLALATEDSSSWCYGWVSGNELSSVGNIVIPSAPADETPSVPIDRNNIQVGDIVTFTGSTHHVSAWDTSGGYFCTPGQVVITAVSYGGDYRYHAVGTDGSSCYGWVSVDDLI